MNENGYWDWMFTGGIEFSKWMYTEMKPMIVFIGFTFIYWLMLYILSEFIFLTEFIMFELLLVPWVVASLFIITYLMYKGNR